MYFVRTKPLAVALAHSPWPYPEAWKYRLAWAVLLVLSSLGALAEPGAITELGFSGLFEGLAILTTLLTCYAMLRPVRPLQFLALMACLAWPEVVKLVFAAGALALFFTFGVGCGLRAQTMLIMVEVAGWIVLLAVCIRLVVFVRLVRSKKTQCSTLNM